MTKKKRPVRARTLRRNLERSDDKLASARRKLLQLQPGGSPERPLTVESAAVIEARAELAQCPDCGGATRAREHEALTFEGELLRRVTLECRQCGAHVAQFFRISVARPN